MSSNAPCGVVTACTSFLYATVCSLSSISTGSGQGWPFSHSRFLNMYTSLSGMLSPSCTWACRQQQYARTSHYQNSGKFASISQLLKCVAQECRVLGTRGEDDEQA